MDTSEPSYDNESESIDEQIDNNSDHEDKTDDMTYDVYNLTACNFHPVRFQQDKESAMLEQTLMSAQWLVKRIFKLPTEKSDTGLLAVLPAEAFILPREKRIPEPKPETRWERFAKDKGIKNKKRERMVFDEDMQEFRPRYGYKRTKNGLEDTPIVEVKHGQDVYADPWAADRQSKKDRVNKNLKNQLKNQLRAAGKPPRAVKSLSEKYDSASLPGIPIDVENKKGKRGKQGIRQALQLVQHSTASMGRFDEMRSGEPNRKIKGKKQVYRDNSKALSTEKKSMNLQLSIVADKVDKKARGVTNSLAAYEGIIPDAPTDSFRQKKGKGKAGGNSSGKKGGQGKRKSK